MNALLISYSGASRKAAAASAKSKPTVNTALHDRSPKRSPRQSPRSRRLKRGTGSGEE